MEAEKADQFAQLKKYVSEEFDDLRQWMCAKYLANFSVFRSMPDNWALEQLFPIVPIHKLNKKPTEYATLCDINCDSDGIVDKFVDLHDVKQVLELHKLETNEPYYLAMMLVGAYQEVMATNHNLFGLPHEAHIFIGEDGYIIKKVINGATLRDSVAAVRFDAVSLHDSFRRAVMQRIKECGLTNAEGSRLIEFYVKHRITSGPGKLTRAMGIDREHNGWVLSSAKVWLEDVGHSLRKRDIAESPRIGIDYAGEDAKLPWRFTIRDNQWVSK